MDEDVLFVSKASTRKLGLDAKHHMSLDFDSEGEEITPKPKKVRTSAHNTSKKKVKITIKIRKDRPPMWLKHVDKSDKGGKKQTRREKRQKQQKQISRISARRFSFMLSRSPCRRANLVAEALKKLDTMHEIPLNDKILTDALDAKIKKSRTKSILPNLPKIDQRSHKDLDSAISKQMKTRDKMRNIIKRDLMPKLRSRRSLLAKQFSPVAISPHVRQMMDRASIAREKLKLVSTYGHKWNKAAMTDEARADANYVATCKKLNMLPEHLFERVLERQTKSSLVGKHLKPSSQKPTIDLGNVSIGDDKAQVRASADVDIVLGSRLSA